MSALRRVLLLALLALLALPGCAQQHVVGEGEEARGEPEMPRLCPPPRSELDLLLVIDSAGSIGEEQAILLRALPGFLRELSTGELLDPESGEVVERFAPIESIQVGVISADMGTGGHAISTCLEPDFGDDGRLLHEGNTSVPGCRESYPLFQTFERGAPGADLEAFAADLGCVAHLGIGSCGFEQMLEAPLKALSPASASFPGVAEGYAPPTFFRGTSGQGDGANAGFLREGSLLALLLLTDEEDCSLEDPELLSPDSPEYSGVALNLRCSTFEEQALHPVERYIEGLLALRPYPERLFFGVLSGVPVDLVADPSAIDYERIFADRRMQQVPDESMTTLIPSCNTENGLAFPPLRMLRVARGIEARGGHGLVQSVCQNDYGPPLSAMARTLLDPIPESCRMM